MQDYSIGAEKESWDGSVGENDDYPNGLAWEFVAKAKKVNKPSDVSVVIELEVELDKLQLKSARDFYNGMVSVMDKYGVMKTDCK